jgi:hypothetical protein
MSAQSAPAKDGQNEAIDARQLVRGAITAGIDEFSWLEVYE